MKSIQIVFKNKGVMVEKWIVDGSTSLAKRTAQAVRSDKITCETHDDMLDTEFTSEGIFCKTCGIKLRLVPEWVVP